jgi:hypothetical protein
VAGAAHAAGEIESKMTAADKAKLAAYETTRSGAIAQARAGGSKDDLAALDAALAGKPQDLRKGFDPRGDWRCRVIKLGKTEPLLVVYSWFACRVAEDDYGVRLEKTSGSQRTSGYFYDAGDTRMIYLGALHYGDEKPTPYGVDEKRNMVAYAFALGPNRMRLEFPAPEYESLMDVLEMERR